jgi:hypothetical protein
VLSLYRRARLATLTGLVLAGVVGSGAARAFWTAGGAGASAAGTGTLQAVTVAAVVAGDTPSSALLPGGPAADVILRVHNPNSVSVQVYSVTGNGPVTADSGHSGCTTTGVTFTPPAAPVTPTVTVPGGSTILVHLPGAATMSTAAQASCQGATFHIPVTLTATR